ncbi:MAG TPA: D-glycerate dehydrogenase [Firmicutes bacterium]|nr:D-glycerate dehydrogenase [Bacillota bacterium]
MASWNVYVTRQIPDAGLKLLRDAGIDFDMNPHDRVLTRDELLAGVRGRDAVLCLLTDTIDAEVLDASRGARIFANYAVGFNNVDVAAATERGVLVTNTPGVLTDTTADMAWALMFAAGRRIAEADRFTRAGKFEGWGPMLLLGQDITGATLGIVGPGRIGTAVAQRAKGFNMRVLIAGPDPSEEILGIADEQVSLDELLRESDFVSLHVPLVKETHHLIGERELQLMKPTAYLINTSRGPVVDEKALVHALRDHVIAGAGLDVFEDEPALAPGLAELENVVIAPHIASATNATRSKMATMAAENLLAGLRGETPPNLVNPEVLAKR